MKYWAIAWHVDATGHCVVAAETEEEAKEIADGFSADRENTELGDPLEIVSCIEIGEEGFKRQAGRGHEVK